MADEKRFGEKLKTWLESEGIYALGTPRQDMKVPPCGYWEKRWGGGKYVKSGLPDMHVVVRNVSIEIELKSATGTASPLQKQKLAQIADSGCIGFVARPADFHKIQNLIQMVKALHLPWQLMMEESGLERVVMDDA